MGLRAKDRSSAVRDMFLTVRVLRGRGAEGARSKHQIAQGQSRTRGPGGLHGHFQPRHRLLRPANPSQDAVKTGPPPSPRSFKSPTRSKKTFASREGFFLDRVGAPFCTCWPGLGGVRRHGFGNPGQRNQVSERFNCWPEAGADDAVAPSGAHALRAAAFGRMAREVCNGAC